MANKKVAFVTGAGGYIGSETARQLAAAGYAIAAFDINAETAQKIADEITAAGGTARAYAIDVADPDNVNEAFGKAYDDLGGIYAMIHVAGGSARIAGKGTEYRLLHEQEVRVIKTVIDVNLMGAIYTDRAAINLMLKMKPEKVEGRERQPHRGKIIDFSSTVGVNGLAWCTEYAAAKAGVLGLVKSLAKEVGQYKINVNSVAPGVVSRPAEGNSDAYECKTNFLGEKCLASDVAALVKFLVSEEADFITGQTYIVDGGRSLAMKGTD